jgi:hypothetical protein
MVGLCPAHVPEKWAPVFQLRPAQHENLGIGSKAAIELNEQAEHL